MKKLSDRAQYYIVVLLVPLIVDVLFFLLLHAEGYGAKMPVLIRFGSPAFIYVVAVAWLLTHLPRKRP